MRGVGTGVAKVDDPAAPVGHDERQGESGEHCAVREAEQRERSGAPASTPAASRCPDKRTLYSGPSVKRARGQCGDLSVLISVAASSGIAAGGFGHEAAAPARSELGGDG